MDNSLAKKNKRRPSNLIQILPFILLYIIILIGQRLGLINNYVMTLVMLSCINIIMTLSLQLINGFTGLFSLGQAGFMSIGAYMSAIMTTLIIKVDVPSTLRLPLFILALILGGLTAALIGLLIGLPTLRLSGDYLAIATLAFGEIIRQIWRLVPAVGGSRGLSNIPQYSNFSVIFIVATVTILFLRNFRNTRLGRDCIAVRENEIAASTLGINTYKTKIKAFVISAFIAGVAGALFSHLYTFIMPDQFSMVKSNDFLVYLFAGGANSISGALVSATILTLLPELLRFLADWRVVIYSVLLIIIMLRRPQGLFGNYEFPFMRIKNDKYSRKGKQ